MTNSYYSIIEPIVCTASRLEVIANRYLFGPIGMNISTVKIIGLLCKRKNMTPSEIMQLIGGTKSNVSQRLDSLEKKGYVKIYKSNLKDKRKISVKLTVLGEKKMKELKKHFDKVRLELESHFSQKEIQQHFAFFNKLNKFVDSEEKYFFQCKNCKPPTPKYLLCKHSEN